MVAVDDGGIHARQARQHLQAGLGDVVDMRLAGNPLEKHRLGGGADAGQMPVVGGAIGGQTLRHAAKFRANLGDMARPGNLQSGSTGQANSLSERISGSAIRLLPIWARFGRCHRA